MHCKEIFRCNACRGCDLSLPSVRQSLRSMAADHFAGEKSSSRVNLTLIPSLQDAKTQATKIYAAMDAKGYGIIKRQQLAEALPENKVEVQRVLHRHGRAKSGQSFMHLIC